MNSYRRLRKEYQSLCRSPIDCIKAHPLESNILHWHYVIIGVAGTPYEGGYYHGLLRFPMEYPLKPPSILMYTPNGRFRTDQRICMSMSDFHPESWNPMWSVSSILIGLQSFMTDNAPAAGTMVTSIADKRKLAHKSLTFNCRNVTFTQLFPDLVELHQKIQEEETAASTMKGIRHRSNGDTALSIEKEGHNNKEICAAPPLDAEGGALMIFAAIAIVLLAMVFMTLFA